MRIVVLRCHQPMCCKHSDTIDLMSQWHVAPGIVRVVRHERISLQLPTIGVDTYLRVAKSNDASTDQLAVFKLTLGEGLP